MTAPTHVPAAIAVVSFVSLLHPVYALNPKLLFVAVVFSLLPDLDNPRSFVGRILFFASRSLNRTFGHRTFTHSFFGCFLVAFSVYAVCLLYSHDAVRPLPYAVTAFFAYFSHLLLDMATKQGIMLYWPYRAWVVLPPVASMRIQTGARIELLFFFAFLLAAVLFLPMGQDKITATFNRVFSPGAVQTKAKEIELQKHKATHGFSLAQIDSLEKLGIIDPKQAEEMRMKYRELELDQEAFEIQHGTK